MNTLSKAKLKLFTALQQKKNRYERRQHLIEGWKLVEEALATGTTPTAIILAPGIEVPSTGPFSLISEEYLYTTTQEAFDRLSSHIQSEGIIAVVDFPFFSHPAGLSGAGFVLDRIQDPGNLGTLIRTADWFGMHAVVCSKGTADWTNPKVLRSSMGAIFRVPVVSVEDLAEWLTVQDAPIVVADMQGTGINERDWQGNEWMVLGNEANGIAPALAAHPKVQVVSIPGGGGAESLNVATAGSILAWQCFQART